MDLKDLKLEPGMYKTAAANGQGFNQLLENLAIEKDAQVETDVFKNKTLYEVKQIKQSYRNAGEEVPLTTFEKLLNLHDIIYRGSQTSTVEKFYQSSDIAILFPEYIQQEIYASAIRDGIWEEFVAGRQTITGLKYKTIYLEDTAASRSLARTVRGSEFARSQVVVSQNEIDLIKYGRILEFDYESWYFTSLAQLKTKVFDRIGQQIKLDITDRMISVLLNGDGNSNGLESDQTVSANTSGEIDKTDIIAFSSCLPEAYQLDKFIGRKTYMRKYWESLSDMTNPAAQKAEIGIPLPPGKMYDRSALTADLFLGVDRARAIDIVSNETMIMTETQNIIQKQTVDAVISIRVNFSIIDQDAIGALDIVA